MIENKELGIRVGVTVERGRGVFSLFGFERGQVIEEAPVVVFPCDRWWCEDDNTVLSHYSFKWDEGRSALVLGYGSLYNHSYTPNVLYCGDSSRSDMPVMRFIAVRRIAPGEELLINYRGTGGVEPVRFDVK